MRFKPVLLHLLFTSPLHMHTCGGCGVGRVAVGGLGCGDGLYRIACRKYVIYGAFVFCVCVCSCIDSDR